MDTRPDAAQTHVVVLTHVFPRHSSDAMGAFLLHLAAALEPRASVDVIAPHARGLNDVEAFGTTRVHRFHYAPARWERLAYTGAMHDLVARSLVNKILFIFFQLAFLIKTLAVARARHAHVLHAQWWLPAGVVGALAGSLTRTPLVITTHGTDIEQLRRARWATLLARFVFARARAITCGSNYLREQLLALRVADAKKISVVPMPVNPIFENQPATFNPEPSNFTILTVARLSAQKSIDTLIAALAHLQARGCEAQLVIIGEGEQRGALEQQARALNLCERVQFLGAVAQSHLPRYYAACAVFVLPSVREGMGLVLAEALLCGAPVVATCSGGVTDIVQDGATGLLVPERDASALADAIQRLYQDRALAQRLASNGRTWVHERFLPEGVADQFLQIFQLAIRPMRANS